MAREEHANWCELVTGLWHTCDCGFDDELRDYPLHDPREERQPRLAEGKERMPIQERPGRKKEVALVAFNTVDNLKHQHPRALKEWINRRIALGEMIDLYTVITCYGDRMLEVTMFTDGSVELW